MNDILCFDGVCWCYYECVFDGLIVVYDCKVVYNERFKEFIILFLRDNCFFMKVVVYRFKVMIIF